MEWTADESKAGGAQLLPQVCCIQETRIKSATKQVSAMSWGRRHGYHFSFGMAHSTGPSRQQSSSGVAVGVCTLLGPTPTATTMFEDCSSRAVARIVNVGFPKGLVVISVYFVTGKELSGPNLDLLQT
eukprot:8814903-Pyramimonas_sp.AAC.1